MALAKVTAMQAANPQFAPPPMHRADTYSPSSSAHGSDWSGMNIYNGSLRPDGGFLPPLRGDSRTPPDADGAFDPRPPNRAQTFAAGSPTEQQDRRGPSENGSRASSRAGSSRNSDMSLRDPRSQRYQRAESELRQHYAVLRTYLKGGQAQPPRTNKARDKLLRLSPVQFHELSTDVFDELQRRQAAQPLPGRPPRQDKVPPFLQPRSDFHEKRNQARQKLSSLQVSRFRDLSTDVFCELERRFPHFNPDNKRESTRSQSRGPPGRPPNGMPPGQNGFGPPPRAHTTQASVSSNSGFPPRAGSMMPPADVNGPSDMSRPTPKQFQSNTVMPNKSTMVEDDDEDDDAGPLGRYDRSSDAFGLEHSLTSPRRNRNTSTTSMTSGSRYTKSGVPGPEDLQRKVMDLEQRLITKDGEIKELSASAKLAAELQEKIDQADRLNQSLRDEVERFRKDAGNGSENQELQQQLQNLQVRYDQQLRTTEDVSKQFRSQLADMRAIADEHSSSMQREEQLHTEVQRLKEECAEWKARYAKAKTQMKNVRLSTIGLNVGGVNGVQALRDQAFYTADGAVGDVLVTKFQLSIDELLGSARGPDTTAVLDHIKDLVLIIRQITADVEREIANDKVDESARKKTKMKNKVSTTTNNVITAAKNYAAAHGLSPVSLLDAAASHLTASVVDLLRTVKIRPASSEEVADGDGPHLTPVNKNGYFNVRDHHRRPSAADSVYSALSDPPEPDPRTPVAPTMHQAVQLNGAPYGLGIQASQFQQDDAELEELKVCTPHGHSR